MGICYSDRNKSSNKLFSGESYSNFDKIIFLQKLYMENILSKEEISPFYTSIIYEQIIKEKTSKAKYRHFFKWFDMALSPYHKLLSSLEKEEIIKSLDDERNKIIKKQTENEENSSYSEIPNFAQDISISEQGLRNYFFRQPDHFESRILKTPPATFRWLSWIIMSGVPISRPAVYYTNLLTYDLPEETEEQIQKDLARTFLINESNYKEKINSLYRILRAFANIDKEIGYTQGMNFVAFYLLNISNRNEIDVFYLMMSIFSHTFSNKFGMRGFFIEDFPLIFVFSNIFEKKLNKFFPKVHKHIQDINLTSFSWISFWMQQIYILVFPNEDLFRIWDYFFVYGKNILISLGLSIVELLQDKMMQINDLYEMQQFFKLLNPKKNTIKYKLKFTSIEYDIEKLLKNAVEKYYISNEEIENELKNAKPNFINDFVYDYKSVESNPDVKSEYAIYALNNSKVSSRINFSTISFDSSLKNSSKIKSNEKCDYKNNRFENSLKKLYTNTEEKESEKENETERYDSKILEEDSSDMDFCEEEEEDCDDFKSHIQDIISKHDKAKFVHIK